jgi:hypothetical protein
MPLARETLREPRPHLHPLPLRRKEHPLLRPTPPARRSRGRPHLVANGIHWHINITNKVEYFAPDPQRQTIPWVRVSNADGTSTIYRSPDFKDEPNPEDIRRMDCLDCHNRPAHRYQDAERIRGPGLLATATLTDRFPGSNPTSWPP